MNSFEQLKHLYHQLFNLADEIKYMIESEEYNEAISKLKHKDSLIDKLTLLKKNAVMMPEEEAQIQSIEEEFKVLELENITLLSGMRAEVAQELKKINQNLKVNTAYIVNDENRQGSMADYSE